MSATLRILLPDATTNYIKNPAFRYDTTDWTAVGSTCSRTLDYARFNIASMQIITNGAALNEGAYYRVSSLSNIQESVTASIYVRGQGRVRIRLHDTFGSEWSSKPVDLRADRWQRISVSGRSSGSNDVRLYVETDGNAAQARTFYVDGAQMERHSYPTTYCDGNQDGCRWNVMDHNSVSTRSGYTRAGGRWVELSGPERELEDLYMTVAGGLGAAPIRLNTQDYAFSPGAFLQSSKVLSRPITLTIHAKHKGDPRRCEASLAYLHGLRQQLLDAVRSDKTKGDEAFLIEYQDGDIPLYLRARYEGGLEGEWDVRNQWVNSFPIRLLAVDPFWEEDQQEVAELRFRDYTDSAYFILQRVDGRWSVMGTGFTADANAFVEELAIGRRGEVIAVGSFLTSRANGSIPITTLNRIGYWADDRWNPYGSGANNKIESVTVAPNGYIYVTGVFTSIGGVAANRVAYWDGSSWNAMGSGLNNNGLIIRSAPNGDIYVGGVFTTAGGLSAYRIARWDGSSWHAVGPRGGFDSGVYAIAISDDGSQIFFGGNFRNEQGLATNLLNYVAEYSPATGLLSAMGTGFDAEVDNLFLLSSGRLYACGFFTTSGDATLTLPYLAYWNGAQWFALGGGSDLQSAEFSTLSSGAIVIAGEFTTIGGMSAGGIALWLNSAFSNLDIDTYGETGGRVVARGDDIFYAFVPGAVEAGLYRAAFSSINLIDNIGSTEASPIVYIKGPASLRWLENQSTKKRVYTNLDILNNEEVFIDFGKGEIRSTIRGSLAWAIGPGSDIRDWTLIPGENKIAAFMMNDVNAVMRISYVPRHWSGDSTNRQEEL